jgi:transcriptional regulator with XRE-family HTH domain
MTNVGDCGGATSHALSGRSCHRSTTCQVVMSAPSTFPSRLSWWRKRRGLSQLQLAMAAACSQRHISFLELSRTKPSREMVLRLSAALDVARSSSHGLIFAACCDFSNASRDVVAAWCTENKLQEFQVWGIGVSEACCYNRRMKVPIASRSRRLSPRLKRRGRGTKTKSWGSRQRDRQREWSVNSSNTLSRQSHRLLQVGVALLLFTSFEGFPSWRRVNRVGMGKLRN